MLKHEAECSSKPVPYMKITKSGWSINARPPPTTFSGGLVGYSAHVLGQQDPARYVRLIENGGATSLRVEVRWASVEATQGRFNWTGPDEVVSEASRL